MKRFKPGDIAWYSVGWNMTDRKPVLIVRKAMCKDFSSWDRRNKTAEGITFARHISQMCWLAINDGQTEVVFDRHLYKHQFKKRRTK